MSTFDQIMTSLRQGNYAPVYMLCGEEPYYIDAVCDYIAANALDEVAREFDQTILYGKDLQGADITSAVGLARGFAMMGGRKVVIVKEAQTIKKWEALNLYMDNPQPDTVLVICYKYGTPDKRLNVWKTFEKRGGVMMQSDRLRDYQVEKWITDYLSKHLPQGVSVGQTVPALLAAHLGTDLSAVVSAVDKLVTGLPEGQTIIDAAMVDL